MLRRARARATLITFSLLLLLISLFYYTFRGTRLVWSPVWWHAATYVPTSGQCHDAPSTSSQVLNGPPSTRYRDNLRDDRSYITAWSNAGFTNQFMNQVNMIYLGTIANRIPIIPPFAPDHHISSSAGIIPFGDIFDLTHLRKVLRSPILEWRDVKRLPSHNPYSTSEIEDLGCWSTRKENATEPIRAENVVHHLGLDVAYTRVPLQTRFKPSDSEEPHVVFSQLAAIIYPVNPLVSPRSLPNFAPSPLGHSLGPDDRLTCFDALYYATSGVDVYEWRFSWSPVWQSIARHVKFTQPMLRLGREYLGRAFRVHESQELPQFIAVHIRRGDFSFFCSTDGRQDCLPPLSAYKRHVNDVVAEIRSSRDLVPRALQVLVMSDEVSPQFWEEVRQEGWYHINHTTERTLERFGEWYPPLIDVVMQSYAVGFVGTEDSTFSLIGQRRVEHWNGGVVRTVDVRKGF
ncbi:hypothetical protein BYT27DRAFT_7131069 [Phlegmacium glaucopus]|nr:hypothetical protein BYT27DRAFT_7131069 [Phlegmacium glaucopus]